jgi:hypothetical protein
MKRKLIKNFVLCLLIACSIFLFINNIKYANYIEDLNSDLISISRGLSNSFQQGEYNEPLRIKIHEFSAISRHAPENFWMNIAKQLEKYADEKIFITLDKEEKGTISQYFYQIQKENSKDFIFDFGEYLVRAALN